MGVHDRVPVTGITIDDASSPGDFDDGFRVQQEGSGWLVEASIADVGSQVQINSAADREALYRKHTIYAEPVRFMLPVDYVELLSLREGQMRPTVTVTIPLSSKLVPGDLQIQQTLFTSQKRLSHEEAARIMADPALEHHAMLQQSHQLATGLYELMTWTGAARRFTNNSYLMVEQLRVLANLAMAAVLWKSDVPVLWRKSRFPHYARFSGLREYEGIVNQRQMNAALNQLELPYSESGLAVIGDYLDFGKYEKARMDYAGRKDAGARSLETLLIPA